MPWQRPKGLKGTAIAFCDVNGYSALQTEQVPYKRLSSLMTIVTIIRDEDWDHNCLMSIDQFSYQIDYLVRKLGLLRNRGQMFCIRMCQAEYYYLQMICEMLGLYNSYQNGVAQLYFLS